MLTGIPVSPYGVGRRDTHEQGGHANLHEWVVGSHPKLSRMTATSALEEPANEPIPGLAFCAVPMWASA